IQIDLNKPDRKNWREIVPEDKRAVLEDAALVAGRLYLNYLRDVVSQVRVHDPDGKLVREIAFPSLGTVSGVAGEWSGREAFYSFSSFHIPPTIYRELAPGFEQSVWFRSGVPIASDR